MTPVFRQIKYDVASSHEDCMRIARTDSRTLAAVWELNDRIYDQISSVRDLIYDQVAEPL